MSSQTGVGKTLLSLQACFQLFNEDRLDKALFVCTKSSILSFEGDIQHTNYKKCYLKVIKNKEDIEFIEEDEYKLFIIQYETLLNISLITLIRAFKGFRSGLFIDEVHRVKTAGKCTKSGQSKQSQTAAALTALKKAFTLLVGLTATTITSELEDGYRVINFIAPGVLGGYKWFRENFCKIEVGERWVPKLRRKVSYSKVIGYKNLDKFLSYTKEVMIQYFPKLDYRFHLLQKSMKKGSQRAQRYEELAGLSHEEGFDKHSSIMPRLQRLVDKSPAKREMLESIVDRCRQDGIIVYSRTRKGEMLEHIRDILLAKGMEVKIISGSTKKEERQKIIKWGFKDSPNNKAIIITAAGAQSCNLQWTCNLVFWEIPMGIGAFLQCKGRIGRMYSRWKQYHFWFILVKNTIDEYWYLRFTSSKEMIGNTSSDIAIPTSVMNKYNEKKLKKLRNKKIWRKGGDKGECLQKSHTTQLEDVKRMNGLNVEPDYIPFENLSSDDIPEIPF